jgi:hypothetical protein
MSSSDRKIALSTKDDLITIIGIKITKVMSK